MIQLCLIAFSLIAGCGQQPYHAHWDGKVWSCPANTDTWVDEKEALKDNPKHPKDFVYCVPKTHDEIEGVRE